MGTLVLLWLLFNAGPPASPSAPRPWPCRIATATHDPSLLPTLWELSPTFQHQCRRLASAGVVVVVQRAHDLDVMHHAETRILRQQGHVFRAVVRLRATGEPAVQFVHELEHVMEALEGVDHRSSRLSFKTRAGGYETARAMRAGAWARRELAPLSTASR
jgi:hypothetical protein